MGITLADEVLTPDSSRFWPADKYAPGQAQDSYDKQYVRDYLEEIHWNKQPPAPALAGRSGAQDQRKVSRGIFSSRDASWMSNRTSGATRSHGMPAMTPADWLICGLVL